MPSASLLVAKEDELVSTDGQRASKLALRFFSNSAIYGLAAILVRFGSLVVLPFYWQVLTPADFGVIAVAQIIPTFLVAILDLGLSGSLQRHFHEWKESEKPKHIASIWTFSLVFSLVLCLLLSLFASHLSDLFQGQIGREIVWLGIWTAFFQNFGIVPFSLWRVREQLPLYSLLLFVQFVVQTSAIVLFIFGLKLGYLGYIYGIFVGAVIYGLLSLFFVLREVRFPWTWKDHLKEPVSYALPAVPSAIFDGLGGVLDRVFLQKYVPLGELGLYSLSRQFGQAFNFFQSTLKNSWVPLVYRLVAERKDAPKVIGRMSSYYFVVLMAPALAISVLSEDVVQIINQPDYFGVTQYIPIFVLAFVTVGLGHIFGRGLDLAKKMQYYWIVYGANFAANLGLLALWAPKYGAWGAVFAFLVAGIIREILHIGMACYFYPRPFEWKPVVGTILIQGVAYFACAQMTFDSHWISFLMKSLVIGISTIFTLMTVMKFEYWWTGEWKKLLTKVE